MKQPGMQTSYAVNLAEQHKKVTKEVRRNE